MISRVLDHTTWDADPISLLYGASDLQAVHGIRSLAAGTALRQFIRSTAEWVESCASPAIEIIVLIIGNSAVQ